MLDAFILFEPSASVTSQLTATENSISFEVIVGKLSQVNTCKKLEFECMTNIAWTH